jgi:hypothetical protein
MSDPKPFASLSSGLLARKGAAKPAMRPQSFGQMGFGLEDLGWNDMGNGQLPPGEVHPIRQEEAPEHVPSSIAALTPAPKNDSAPDADMTAQRLVPSPVVEQQRAIEESFAEKPPVEAPMAEAPMAEAKVRAAIVQLAPRPRQEPGAKAKAAFTLRLDTQRHLKLRLACAVTHRSAQGIVTQALDHYLDSLPELDSLASQVPAKLGKRS